MCTSDCIQQMNLIQRNIWYLKIFFIGCMEEYTSGDYFYLKELTGIHNEHHNPFRLNQIHDMYITLTLKFMDEIFESFPNLSID